MKRMWGGGGVGVGGWGCGGVYGSAEWGRVCGGGMGVGEGVYGSGGMGVRMQCVSVCI